jgi:hypothetical protein
MSNGDHNKPGRTRLAAYARLSSALPNRTSIEDQLRNCRAAAEKNGWTVLEEFIRSDTPVTGRVQTRPNGSGNPRKRTIKPIDDGT